MDTVEDMAGSSLSRTLAVVRDRGWEWPGATAGSHRLGWRGARLRCTVTLIYVRTSPLCPHQITTAEQWQQQPWHSFRSFNPQSSVLSLLKPRRATTQCCPLAPEWNMPQWLWCWGHGSSVYMQWCVWVSGLIKPVAFLTTDGVGGIQSIQSVLIVQPTGGQHMEQ